MQKDPLVSVIIPFYNSEKFLKEAIDSVIIQTYKNWELILIDDGSNDGSTDIALNYSNQFSNKIYYLEYNDHINKGACASRNLGIQNSRGHYIALLDSDDVWLPNKLEQQIEIFNCNKNIDAIFGLSEYWHSWTGNTQDINKDNIPELGILPDIAYEPGSLIKLIFPLGKANAPCPSVLILTKEILERIGGFEEAFTGIYQYYEDQVFLSKLYMNATIYPTEMCWIKYRIHPDSCSSRVRKLGERDRVKLHYFHWLKRYFYENGFNEKSILELLNKSILELESNMEIDVKKWEKIAKNREEEINKLKKQIAFLEKKLGRGSIYEHSNTNKNLSSGTLKTASTKWSRSLRNYIPSSVQFLISTFKNNVNIRSGKQDNPFGRKKLKEPLSKRWGWERGTPIDRYYIEKFLEKNSKHIKGNVLEINDNNYTKNFGGHDVIKTDVLDIDKNNKHATIIADLQKGENIESFSYDCIILTQTLQFIYDYDSVIKTCYRILKKDGAILATFPGITKIFINKAIKWYWNFTSFSAEMIFNKYFDQEKVEIYKYGNVLAASAFLYGLALEELSTKELEYNDPEFELLICVKAVK